MRVDVKPNLLRWACERAGLDTQIVAARIPQLPEWEQGKKKPTLKQVEHFAHTVHVPVGFLFLPTPPPPDALPIPDYRTIGNAHIGRPSPDLLETIYLSEQRQEWYRDYARAVGLVPCEYVGSAVLDNDVVAVAENIRRALKFEVDARRKLTTWEDALRQFIAQADEVGVLVMVNGVVGSNNRRKLDNEEFRGFALSDNLAPLVFINGSDTKSAQMFTLAHELSHIWLGKTGLSDVGPATYPTNNIEQWCDRVAAEILVPIQTIRNEYHRTGNLLDETQRLARYFKVSTLVILRRIHDAGFIPHDEFWAAFNDEMARLLDIVRTSGGNYYWTQAARVSKRFAKALIISTLEGQTLHRDAFRLLGFSKLSTFRELGSKLRIM
jgi:Zn-dependent peptidase ImmA (M78 family)